MKTEPDIIDILLIAESEQAIKDILSSIAITVDGKLENVGFINDDEFSNSGKGFALKYLGQIVTTQATFDENGEEVTPAVLSDQVHCDIRLIDTPVKLFPKEYDNRASEIEAVLNVAIPTGIASSFTSGVMQIFPKPVTPSHSFA